MSDTSKTFNTFAINRGSYGISDFLKSDSLIVKFIFLILVVIVFVFFLRLGLSLLNWLMQSSGSPRLINGMVDAKQQLVFPQDPNTSGAIPIKRSVDESKGIEFTWSVWLYINDLEYNKGKYRHIFHKGNSSLESTGLNFPNNSPGMYIAPDTNSLVIMMNTFKVINEEIVVPNIPLNKWVNVIIRCRNTILDVYVNGTIVRSIQLTGVPKQNYGEVFVAQNGGFDGNISNLWYYDYALGTTEILSIANNGPNTKLINGSGMITKPSDYLSLRWYFYGNNDMYNP